MSMHHKRTLVLSFILLQIAFFSYFNFVAYKPKVLRQLTEVKGARAVETDTLPYPEGYKKISFDTTFNNKITTVEVSRTTKEIHDFYKNVLLSKGWEVESETALVVKYKKSGKFLTITTAPQSENDTILSIETTR